MFGCLENPGQFPVQRALEGIYWWLYLIDKYDSYSFFIIYVFEVEESISDIPSEPPCSGYLGNTGQLPVEEDLGGNDDFVLWIFTIS